MKGRGRPKLEKTIDPAWKDIIIQSGKEGKHITDFLIKLGFSWEGHYALLKRNKEYSEAVNEYTKLCEDYWYNMALNSMNKNGGAGFNARLYSLIMRNKFGNNWQDQKSVDITTQGDSIKEDKRIVIEVVKNTIDKQIL